MIAQQLNYYYFYRDLELRDSVQALEDFYYAKIDENMGKLREIEKLLIDREIALAYSKLSEVLAENTIDDGYKLLYELQWKFQNNSFTSSDSSALVTLATACPYIEGDAVYYAAATYNEIYLTSQYFETNCPPNMPKSLSYNSPHAEVQWDVTLYPNPNDNVLYIESNIADVKKGLCVIYSSDGKIAFNGEVHFYRGLNLKALNLTSGVYIIEITQANGKRVVKRFVFKD